MPEPNFVPAVPESPVEREGGCGVAGRLATPQQYAVVTRNLGGVRGRREGTSGGGMAVQSPVAGSVQIALNDKETQLPTRRGAMTGGYCFLSEAESTICVGRKTTGM